MGDVTSSLPLETEPTTSHAEPCEKLKQMDHLLSLYYQCKGKMYYNDDIGPFIKWCTGNKYSVDRISRQMKDLPENCSLVHFDPNFPTNNKYYINEDERRNEIYQVIRHCWYTPHIFHTNIIKRRKPVPNTYILSALVQKQSLLLHGYSEYHTIPGDVINTCRLYCFGSKKSLLAVVKPSLWKPATRDEVSDLCRLTQKFVEKKQYFVAYQILSMLIDNNEYHVFSSKDKADLFYYRGLALYSWNSMDAAKNDIELAAELYSGYWEKYRKLFII